MEIFSVQQQQNKLRERREVCVLCFLFFPGEKREHPQWASLGFGPRGLAFSFGTGVKPTMDAAPGLPALAAHSQSAAVPNCTHKSAVLVGGCQK